MTILPKLIFQPLSADNTIEVINSFMKTSWAGRLAEHYPELKTRLGRIRSRVGKEIATYAFFKELEQGQGLSRATRRFEKSWQGVNDAAFEALSDALEIKWPRDCREMTALVSFCPICPRFLSNRSFYLFYRCSNLDMRAVVMHEALHFIFFAKWERVFGAAPIGNYEYPHLIWRLSEIVPRAILNDPRIQTVVQHTPRIYDEFKEISIEGRPVLDCIDELYQRRRSFAQFMKSAYAFVKKHRKKLEFEI